MISIAAILGYERLIQNVPFHTELYVIVLIDNICPRVLFHRGIGKHIPDLAAADKRHHFIVFCTAVAHTSVEHQRIGLCAVRTDRE